MKRKKEFIIILASIVVIILSVSVAYFTTKITSKNRKVTVTSSELKMVFTSGSGTINGSNIEPGWSSGENTFTITNESKKEYTYNLIIKDYINTTVTTGFLVYKITSTDGGYNMTDFIDMPKSAAAANTTLAENIPISAKATHTYKIEIKYLDSPTVSQDEDQGKKLSGTIFIDGVKEASSQNPTPTLASKLLEDNPTISTRSDFSTPFTTNTANTLYKATENGTDVYYFAGLAATRSGVGSCQITSEDYGYTFSTENGSDYKIVYANTVAEAETLLESWTGIVLIENECKTENICLITGEYWAAVLGVSEEDCLENGIEYNPVVNREWEFKGATFNKDSTSIINNWVKFGKNSSNQDLYWRIIRTNADGSIRLLYSGTSVDTTNGSIGTSTFNTTRNSPKYVGYMYGDSDATLEEARTNTNDSTIKTYIDNWYENNLTSYTNYLSKDAIYCNDRELASGETYSTGTRNIDSFDFKSNERLYTNKTPTYDCTNIKDAFSVNNAKAKLTYPIALMTADEIAYAGGVFGQNTPMWYDINSEYNSINGSYWWSLSPGYRSSWGNSTVWLALGSGNSGCLNNGTTVDSSSGVRPVVSLKSCVQWKSGNGSSSSPYEIALNGGC